MVLAILVATASVSSCGASDLPTTAEDEFVPMSEEEERTHDRIVHYIDAAENLLNDGRLTREQSNRLEAAVSNARRSLDEFMDKRSQGYTRGVVVMSLGSASAGVVGNDVTIVGVADDWMLIPIGIATITTYIFTDAPATKGELEKAWYRVGGSMQTLGETVESIGLVLNQNATQAGPEPRPNTAPQDPKVATVDGVPLVPAPVPAPKDKPRDKREECRPTTICPHKGQDNWHNYCADTVLGNEFPGCDVVINGKAFDAKSGNTLYEIKTDDWDTYSEFLVNETLKDHAKLIETDGVRANACGYRYEFIVGDATLAAELSQRVTQQGIVRHEPRCNRKPYKAGKTNVP